MTAVLWAGLLLQIVISRCDYRPAVVCLLYGAVRFSLHVSPAFAEAEAIANFLSRWMDGVAPVVVHWSEGENLYVVDIEFEFDA